MAELPERVAARLIVLDASQHVLLVRYDDSRPGRAAWYWAAPGGALEPEESPRAAARRELEEETGLSAEIGRELWVRRFELEMPSGRVRQSEQYFLVELPTVTPPVHNSTPEAIREHRWWSLAALRATTEVVYPEGLTDSLAEVLGR
jgi:8-oxo-dGTP pyrophosphatase MutT (NUDIX family)